MNDATAGFNVRRAATFRARLFGLLLEPQPWPDAALYLEPCAAVHTFGMRFELDLVFVDAHATVIQVRPAVPAWRIVLCPGARATLEFAGGAIERFGIEPGQRLRLQWSE